MHRRPALRRPRLDRIGKLLPVALLTLAAGCAAGPTEAEVEAATAYLYPEFKYVEEPRFSFTPAERARALRDFRDAGADTLFEVVVDGAGHVQKARLLRTHVHKQYHSQMEAHALRFVFTEDARSAPFRTFYFPMQYRFDASFEWVDR
jgi:hypothetical protein